MFGDTTQDEDAGEEKKLLAILLKLKAAKACASSSKKRKHCERVVEEQLGKYQATVRDVLAKFTDKRAAAHKRLRQSYDVLVLELVAARKSLQTNHERMRGRLLQRRDEAAAGAERLERCVRADLASLRVEHERSLNASRGYAQEQVQYKLGQLEEWVGKLDSGSKQDELSALIQRALANF